MKASTTTAVAVQGLCINGLPVRQDKDGMISLTDLYQIAQSEGLADGKRNPSDWSREAGAQFIEFAAKLLNTRKTGIYKTTRGKGGGTFAHIQIALSYAEYLSPQFQAQVNDVYLRAKSGDVTLAEEIFDKASAADQQKHAERVNGKVARVLLTSCLAQHGVHGRGYGDCTNAIYLPVIGTTAAVAREQRGLKVGANVRDAMDAEELARVSLAEIIARKNIENRNMHGNAACQSECYRAGMAVAAVH